MTFAPFSVTAAGQETAEGEWVWLGTGNTNWSTNGVTNVVVDQTANATAIWGPFGDSINVARSQGGENWTPSITSLTISKDSSDHDVPIRVIWSVVDDHGVIQTLIAEYLNYSSSNYTTVLWAFSYVALVGWSNGVQLAKFSCSTPPPSPAPSNETCSTFGFAQIVSGRNGEAWAVWTNYGGYPSATSITIVSAHHTVQEGWGSGVTIANRTADAELWGQPLVTALAPGQALIGWSVRSKISNATWVEVVRYGEYSGWGLEKRVAFNDGIAERTTELYLHGLSGNERGEAVVSWEEISGASWTLFASRRNASGAWSGPEELVSTEVNRSKWRPQVDVGPVRGNVALAAAGDSLIIWTLRGLPLEAPYLSVLDVNGSAREPVQLGEAWEWDSPIPMYPDIRWSETRVGLDSEGQSIIVWAHSNYTSSDIWWSVRSPSGNLTSPERIYTKIRAPFSCGAYELNLALGRGLALLTWRNGCGDGTGMSIEMATFLRVDRKAPAVSIIEPLDRTSTDVPSVFVRGQTESSASVTVNGVLVAVSEVGTFEVVVALNVGENAIVATARDAAGNSANASVSVIYSPPKPPDVAIGEAWSLFDIMAIVLGATLAAWGWSISRTSKPRR